MPPSPASRWKRRTAAAAIASTVMVLGLPTLGAQAASGPNAAADAPAKAGSVKGRHVAANISDGDADTYWQAGKKSAQWVQTDLGQAKRVREVVLRLPAHWEARKQTFALQGSADGKSFATLKPSAQYVFSPGNGNRVKVAVPATLARYVRADFSANSAADTAQVAELHVLTTTAATPNLAQGKTFSASGHADVYGAGNAGDGNRNTYWESKNNALPQWVQVDLGSSVKVNQVTLRLPGGWPDRSQ
ncbi:discoidin domain-containing protein, partial [Streptomyces californicus]|uniref:galactose-binding domain-containing protein n=1 Tax=Streptomyces californicus TaxID=67351 RepID=UPI0037155BEB